eukprot:3605813-Rhodomonas_salina.2
MCMVLRACYAMPGTNCVYGATAELLAARLILCWALLLSSLVCAVAGFAIVLCACYAMPGTDLAYGPHLEYRLSDHPTRLLCEAWD